MATKPAVAPVLVRKARLPEERPIIDGIHDAAFDACHRPILGPNAVPWFEPIGTCFVAEDATGRVCGFVYVCLAEDVLAEEASSADEEPPPPRIDDLFVHPDCHGCGIGSMLLARAEAFAAPATLNLCVLERDVRVRHFYERRGWIMGARYICNVDGGEYLHASKPFDPVVATLPPPDCDTFAAEGFVTMPELVERAFCDHLNARLELVLRGEYDTGGVPDKAPPFKPETRCKPGKAPPPLGGPSKRTLQVVNVWKADHAFAAVVRSPTLGRYVAQLAGWPSGARVANDQVWAKPPGGAALTFHRDSAYLDFEPADVATVWIALDDMEDELGPLEYAPGSHLWGDGRVGSASQFFDGKDRHALLHDAARREGIAEPADTLRIERLSVRVGGAGVHNGRLWHGSGRNASASRPRRGLGVHFVPAHARFRDPAAETTLAHRFRAADGGDALPPESFPITWQGAAVESSA